MFEINNPFSVPNNASFETMTALAHHAFQTTERLAELNASALRSWVEGTVSNTRSLMNLKAPQDLLSAPTDLGKPFIDQSLDYTRNIGEIAFESQEKLFEILGSQAAIFNKSIVSGFEGLNATHAAPANARLGKKAA